MQQLHHGNDGGLLLSAVLSFAPEDFSRIDDWVFLKIVPKLLFALIFPIEMEALR
jgi:hypothetical protein